MGGKRSFSLIETAVALAVLVLILGGFLAVFERGFFASRKTKQAALMHNLARQVLEQYSDWGLIPANGVYALPALTFNNVIYSRTLTIADGPCVLGQPCPPNSDLKQVNITVSTGTYSFSLAVLKANY